MFFEFVLRQALKQKEDLFLSKVVPFCELIDKSLLATFNSNVVSVVEILGKDYQSLSDEKRENIYFQVKAMFNSLQENINITFHTRKIKEKTAPLNKINDFLENKIGFKWSDNFSEFFSYRYFIVLSSSVAPSASQVILGNAVKNSLEKNIDSVKLNRQRVINLLGEFSPRLLRGKDLLEFYYHLINARESFGAKSNEINEFLAASNISFAPDYIVYDNLHKIYSKWISIVRFENEADTNLFFKDLLSLKAEFTIYQNFQKLSMQATRDFIQRRQKYLANFHDLAGDDEFELIKDALLRNEESLFHYGFYMQIFDTSLASLDLSVAKAFNIIERYGYNAKIESENIQSLYHANLCEYEHYLVRKRVKVAGNLSAINSFEKSGDGLYKCSFGNAPVSTFFTASRDLYHFCFHESEKDRALGNTIIVGGSGSGKTTLTTFLISQALAAFPDLIALAFDKHRGMQTITESLQMSYTDFNDE